MQNHPLDLFILTGGPGAGKTSVIEALAARGYETVGEVGRQIIREQVRIGGDAHHTGDQVKFRDLMLSRSLLTYDAATKLEGPVFFDRGLPDLVGYGSLIGQSTPEYISRAVQLHRYNPSVFLFPPWEEIYGKDEERRQDFAEAAATCEAIRSACLDCGYSPVEVPKAPVTKRAAFILDWVARAGGCHAGE